MPEYPGGIDGEGRGEVRKKWNQSEEKSIVGGITFPTNTTLLDTSAVMQTMSNSGLLNWVLSPYAYKPSKSKYAMFRASIEKLLEKNETISDPVSYTQSPSPRD